MFWYPRKAQGHGVPLGSWGGNAQGDELRTRRGRSTVRTRMNSARESDAHATASALRWARHADKRKITELELEETGGLGRNMGTARNRNLTLP